MSEKAARVVLPVDLRDHFAGHALTNLLTNEFVRQELYAYAKTHGVDSSAALAEQAYVLADAMLKARNKKRKR